LQSAIARKLYQQVPALNAEWEKQGARLLVPQVSNSFELQSRMPVVTLDDFKGKKIVISGVRSKKWFEAVGATPVTMSMPDRALALQTGMIDGSVAPLPISHPFGLRKYAKHATFLDFGAWLATGIAINKKLFEGFPKDIQEIILEAAYSAVQFSVDIRKKAQTKAVEALKQEGVALRTMPVEQKAKWMQLMGNQPMDWIKTAEDMGLTSAADVMETYIRLQKDAGHIFPMDWKTIK
jgi:TRAP-type C4-dicarboxylate transport system substrate-binding protein